MQSLKDYLQDQCLDKKHYFYLLENNLSEINLYGNGAKDYYLASTSKSIIGAIYLELISNDPSVEVSFVDYLKSIGVSSKLGVFDFLTHTTDLIDYLTIFDVNHGQENQDIIEKFVINKTVKKNTFNYNNTNFVVLFDFLYKNYNFQSLLNELNGKIFETFKLVNETSFVAYDSKSVFELKGAQNKVYGDGGFYILPCECDHSKQTFAQYFINLVIKNKSLFIDNAIDVESGILYSFGTFYKEINNIQWIFHSGYYHSNIAYFASNSEGRGYFFCTNNSELDKTIIDRSIGLV